MKKKELEKNQTVIFRHTIWRHQNTNDFISKINMNS